MKALLALALLALVAVKGGTVIDIKTPQDFIQLSNDVNSGKNKNATVYLQNDIDFTGFSDQYHAIGEGVNGDYFNGVFDGQGHTISHLTINNTDKWHFGIFGKSSGLTIRNVIVDNTCTITKYFDWTTGPYEPLYVDAGGIVGILMASKPESLLENIIFMGRVSFDGYFTNNIFLAIGGIVGEVGSYDSTLVIRNCVNYGTVAFTGSADSVSIGGVVGVNRLKMGMSTLPTKIYNCLNYGYIVQSGTARYYRDVGGVLGYVGNGYVEVDNVVNFGYISVSSSSSKRSNDIGTIAGLICNTKLTNSYWAAGSTYDVAGSIYETATITQCTNFSAQTFTLMKKVKVGKYSGTSLLGALNAGADSHSSLKYSMWLLNKNNNAVTFAVNGEAPFFKVSTQLILMPTLADGVSKKFSGWYTNSACTTKVTNFEISVDTNLYGKFA